MSPSSCAVPYLAASRWRASILRPMAYERGRSFGLQRGCEDPTNIFERVCCPTTPTYFKVRHMRRAWRYHPPLRVNSELKNEGMIFFFPAMLRLWKVRFSRFSMLMLVNRRLMKFRSLDCGLREVTCHIYIFRENFFFFRRGFDLLWILG